jgi:NAD(P)-dependent dehydrogenase (short-subunit alcohol dehydrogenase family)
MKRVLIVGADSGIGEALFNRIEGSVGTSRRVGSKHVLLDVLSPATYPTFDEKFDEIYFCTGLGGKMGTTEQIIEVNATKAIECLEHLAQYVVDGGSIRVMSSITASLAFAAHTPMVLIPSSYRMSKVALNMGVIRLHHTYPNINWQLVHPGFVRTKMTEDITVSDSSKYIMISPDESAQKILATPVDKRLSFVNVISGHDIPW